MKYGNIFWGVILITLGVLFSLRNLDIFFFSWHSIWRLWPLIFVFWGIALLPVRSMMKLILTVITVIVAILILAKNPGPRYPMFNWWPDRYTHESDNDREEDYSWSEQQFDEDYNSDTKFATLNIDAAAGDFRIKGITTHLFEFKTEGNTGPFSATTRDVGEDKVVIDFDQKRFTGRSNLNNDVWMNLNENPLWKFNIDVGAARMEMDLSPFRVEKVDIDGGASAINLKLGSKFKKTHVKIDAGASGIKIQVPEETACEVRTHTILSGRDMEGFNKIKSGLYQTPNFSDSASQIIIDVDAAVSGVKIERY